MDITITPDMAQAEINRRALNRERKAAARRSGQRYMPKPADNEVVMHLSGDDLSQLAKSAAPAPKPKVRTAPAWNEAGPRGGDPVKRLRAELASTKAEKNSPEWWAEYRATRGMTLTELGLALGYITV